MKLRVWLILVLSVVSLKARTANFLLVEHPAALKIFNIYHQQLSEQEKRSLGQWLPFELKEVTTLSDNVTKVLETRVLNRTYFLLLDAEGQPFNLEKAGAKQWVYRATLLMDTVRIQPGYKLPLLKPKTKTEITSLPEGQWLVRVFKKGQQYFVATISSKPLFGFVKVSQQIVWQKVNQKEFNQNRAWQNFLENLQYLLNTKNAIYQKLYTYFRQEQDSQNIPQWQWRKETDKVILVFTRPELLKQWPESKILFWEELENLVKQNKLKLVQFNDFTLIIERSHQ